MRSGNFSSILKWITGIVLLFSISCKDREWESQATVSTNEITVFSDVAAVVGGTLIDDGHSVVTETGICYSRLPNPDLDDSRVNLSGGLSEFSGKIESLEPGTAYYVRAYAINNIGVSYGEEVSFRTDLPLTDADANEYKTVIIGEQIWMVENLKTTKYNDGTSIPNLTDNTEWSNLTTGAHCWYDNNTENKDVYGALYNWHTVNTNKLCPIGWHVPSESEWNTLVVFLGGASLASGKLKLTTGWKSPDSGATNGSGFSALAGGYRHGYDGTFNDVGYESVWWSSTELNNSTARSIQLFSQGVMGSNPIKAFGLSVRCLRN